MNKVIKIQDLRIGMFVKLPAMWFQHPFLKNEFHIKSQDQIAKFYEYGIFDVTIDPEKAVPESKPSSVIHSVQQALNTPPRTWEPDKLVPVELKEAIHDVKLSAKKKSKIVYETSRVMVQRLFEDPKAENIHVAKKEIADIVDMILVENATSQEMLKLTSFDYYTYTHSVNVGVFSVLLAKSLFNKSFAHDMHEIGAGFFLHDIGKVRINPVILDKAGKLTESETAQMRTHPNLGYNILKETHALTEQCRIIVMQHHERENGTGYPLHLKGDDIHTYGRICCIADVYDALTAERSYKHRLKTFDALKIMKEEMLDHFHKDMFEKFVLLFT